MNAFRMTDKVADHYDKNNGFADSLNHLIPDFEYPDWSWRTIEDVLKKVSAHHVDVIVNALNGVSNDVQLSNPPSSNPKQLLAMSRTDYDQAQEAFYTEVGYYSGSMRGLPTLYAHEVRKILEAHERVMTASELCARFSEFYPGAHKDAQSWLAVGLSYSLKVRPESEKTPEINQIIHGIVNGREALLSLVEAIGITKDKGVFTFAGADIHDQPHSGKVMGVTDQHVVLSLGRSAMIYPKSILDHVPSKGEDVSITIKGEKRLVTAHKALGKSAVAR